LANFTKIIQGEELKSCKLANWSTVMFIIIHEVKKYAIKETIFIGYIVYNKTNELGKMIML